MHTTGITAYLVKACMNSYASKASSELAWLFVAFSDSSADPLCCSLSCNKKFTVDFETHKQFVYLHKLSISLVGVEITPIATTTNTFVVVCGMAGGLGKVQYCTRGQWVGGKG